MSREAPPHTDHGDSAIGTRPHPLMSLSVAEQEYAVGQVATMRRQGLPAPEAKLRSIMGAIPERARFSGRATLIGVSRAASIGSRMESWSSSLHDWLALFRKRETTRKLDEDPLSRANHPGHCSNESLASARFRRRRIHRSRSRRSRAV